MKRIFIFLAAMLLSVGAMAQNGTPLKGDVNGDGKVDVADITAIIDIMANGQTEQMYFYLGTAQPTKSNYQSLPGVTTAYTSIDQAIGTKLSVAAGETLYMLCPIKWAMEKRLYLEAQTGEAVYFTQVNGSMFCPNDEVYTIFKASVPNNATEMTLKTDTKLFWYAGETKPTSLSEDPRVDDVNITVDKWHSLGTLTELSETVYGGTGGLILYVAVPTSVGLKPTASDNVTPDNTWEIVGTITVSGVQYTVWNTYNTNRRRSIFMGKI